MRNMPITVTVPTMRAMQNILRQHSTNWKIQPDFTHIPGLREIEECAADHQQVMLRHKRNFMF